MDTASCQRLFIAAPIPETVQRDLASAQDLLKASSSYNARAIRWTSPERWHLTLKFLGNVAAEKLPLLTETTRRSCDGFAAIPLSAAGIGFFPDARSPRVVWAGINDQTGLLTKLQGAIEVASGEFTAEKPEKKFTPHVTLGRIPTLGRAATKVLAAFAAGIGDWRREAWTCDHIEIVRSDLPGSGVAGGPKYTVLCAIPLASLHE